MRLARLVKQQEQKVSLLQQEVVNSKSIIESLCCQVQEKEMVLADLQAKTKGSSWLSERDDWKFMVQQLQETRAAEAKENDLLRPELRRAELSIKALKAAVASLETAAAAAATATATSAPSSPPVERAPSVLSSLPLPSDDGLLIASLRESLATAVLTIAEKDRQIHLALATAEDRHARRAPFAMLQSYYESASLPRGGGKSGKTGGEGRPKILDGRGGGEEDDDCGPGGHDALQMGVPGAVAGRFVIGSLYLGVSSVLSLLLPSNEGKGGERGRKGGVKRLHEREKEDGEAPVMIL